MIKRINSSNFFNSSKLSASAISTVIALGINSAQSAPLDPNKPNLLFIMTDQQRFDAIRRVQEERTEYDGKYMIETPNLDRLSHAGVYFRNAYTQCPVCAPARSTLMTGCTIERTGAQSNDLVKEKIYGRMSQFENKIDEMESFVQILGEERGYTSEYYGKWHIPDRLHYERGSNKQVIKFNDYNYSSSTPAFKASDEQWGSKYHRYLSYFEDIGEISKTFSGLEQADTYSKYAYTPIQLDCRYGDPTNTPISNHPDRTSQPNVLGRFSFNENYTPTHYNGEVAIKALERLAGSNTPFTLTASFHHPHAPFTAASKYLDKYWDNRSQLFVSPSCGDPGKNSAYFPEMKMINYGYNDPTKIKEWVACYYAMVEEIDVYVGEMLDKLDEYGIAENTMVIFTSDHGELLGAHSSREKNKFIEESVHIPLLISFPGKIAPNTVVNEPVSQLDVFSTVLDYLNAGSLDKSDGASLRRFIEGTNWNESYDDEAIIAEWDFRKPNVDGVTLDRTLGGETNFMVLKGKDKLMLTKKASSNRLDMMYDLEKDPYEIDNLIGEDGLSASNEVIGKAEHLKCLLLEWMLRNDGGSKKYYTDPVYNAGEGAGDYNEIKNRRKWKKLNLWYSDTKLDFGRLAYNGTDYVRNEFLYLGRTTPGNVNISSISIVGADAEYFEVDRESASIGVDEYVKVKVSFSAPSKLDFSNLEAFVRIISDEDGTKDIPIGGMAVSAKINNHQIELNDYKTTIKINKDKIRVNALGAYNLEIYDVSGRVIHRASGINKNTYSIPKISSGIYICRVKGVGVKGVTFTKEVKMLLK